MIEQLNISILEDGLNVFENILEVATSIIEGPYSMVSVIVPFMELLIGNIDSKETVFTNEQFQKVNDRLEVISTDIQRINEEIKRRTVDATYYQVERILNNQFRLFKDIFLVKNQKVSGMRQEEFTKHFIKTQGEQNLNILYNAVTGDNMFGASVLDIALNYEQKSRGPLEKFCTMLKKLFCIGLIALLGYERLTRPGEEEKLQEITNKWDEKMKVVQSKIDEVIQTCINSFPEQAEQDATYIVKKHSVKSNQELADLLMDHLKKKYDWVCWSVRVFNSPTGLFANKKDFHSLAGQSWFKVPVSYEKLNVIISYSASPEPVDKAWIKNLVLDQNKCICKRPSMVAMSKQLCETIPHCVVHTVKTSCKDLGFSCSFSDELHYCRKFKNFNVFLHSENREENGKAIVNS